MTNEGEDLLARLQAAVSWPDDSRVMRAIQKRAETSNLDLTHLVPPLIARLASGDEWSQDAAVRAIGAIGDPRAVEPLCGLLGFTEHQLPDNLGPKPNHAILAHAMVANDEDDVRNSAIRALGNIGDRRALPALRACAENESEQNRIRKAAREVIAKLEAEAP